MSPLLRTEELTRRFGGMVAVDRVSLAIGSGSLHAIIDPNGAGKTTLFHMLSGVLEPTEGRILFEGNDVTRLPVHARVHAGICRSFQITSVFRELSVLENVRLAVQARSGRSREMFTPAFQVGTEPSLAVLERMGLAGAADRPAKELSHGDQRLLDVAIALATDPRLLLLDEPTSGLSANEALRVGDLIRELAGERTVVLIEHNMKVVMRIADRISVMHFGRLIAEGSPAEIRVDPEVRRAYLGERAV